MTCDVELAAVAGARAQPLDVVQLARPPLVARLLDARAQLDRPVGDLQVLERPAEVAGRRLNSARGRALATASRAAVDDATCATGLGARAAPRSRPPAAHGPSRPPCRSARGAGRHGPAGDACGRTAA